MHCYNLLKMDALHQSQMITRVTFHHSVIDISSVIRHYPNVGRIELVESVALNCPANTNVQFVGGCDSKSEEDDKSQEKGN